MDSVWIATFAFGVLTARALISGLADWKKANPEGELAALPRISMVLADLEESIEAGILPEAARWEALAELPRPWGPLAHGSAMELRRSGSAVLPTLKRIRGLADEHRESARLARAQSAQARAQAWVCAILIPLIGLTLYTLLPGLAENTGLWFACVAGALTYSSLGSVWLWKMADDARWAGLPHAKRDWPLIARCTYERLIAKVRSGTPPDLAWKELATELYADSPALVRLFHIAGAREKGALRGDVEGNPLIAIAESGRQIQRTLRASMIEGKPCIDRLEAAAAELSSRMRACAAKELSSLGVRALKPLFICVAPSLLGLIAAGIGLGLWRGI